jgi:N-methylhydantoinase B
VEVIESVVPLVIRRKALRVDSGGAGTFRGGLGIELVVQNVSDAPMQVASRMDRVLHPPEGLEGGMPGACAGIWTNGTKPFPPKGRGELAVNEALVIHSPGGGGYGKPAHRDPRMIDHDVGEELVSESAAKTLYGWSSP